MNLLLRNNTVKNKINCCQDLFQNESGSMRHDTEIMRKLTEIKLTGEIKEENIFRHI